MTAEEFIEVSKIAPAAGVPKQDLTAHSRYDLLHEMLARKLGVAVENVDIFTVLNHPMLARTIDVRYSAHGSPYYRSARLDGIVIQDRIQVRLLSLPYLNRKR